MLKLLASVLKNKFAGPPRARIAPAEDEVTLNEENGPVSEGLVMTDELREALFPKTPQMISTVFDRPAPLGRRPSDTPNAPAQALSAGGRAFPIIF